MKKIINKLNLQSAFFALSITLCAPLCGMNRFTTKLKYHLTNFKWTMKADTYKESTIINDCTMSIFSKIGYKYLKYIQKNDPSLAKKIIADKLTQIKNNLEQDETKAINALAKDYEIADRQQKHIKQLINQYKKGGKWSLKQNRFYVLHDLSFPREIIPILEKNEIHPNQIVLRVSSVAKDNTIAAARAFVFEDYDFSRIIQNKPCASVVYPPRVTLYPRHFDTSENDQLATLIHEVGHITNQDWTTTRCILTGIRALTKIDPVEIEANNSSGFPDRGNLFTASE